MLNYNLKTIIFQCSTNYGSPTRVTSIVASNMADPVLTKTDCSLKWTLLALVCHLLSVNGLSVGFFLNYILSFTCRLSHYYSLTCRYLNVKPDSKLQHAIIHPSKVADIGLHLVFVGLSWINRRHHSLTSSQQAESQ